MVFFWKVIGYLFMMVLKELFDVFNFDFKLKVVFVLYVLFVLKFL